MPSTTETLCALGLAGALAGVTSYCREPRAQIAGKTRVGGEKDPDLARIRGLDPDLVIANVEENVRDHVETLRAWGIPVWVTYPRTVIEAIRMIRDLGAITGTGPQAEAMAGALEDLHARVSAETARVGTVAVFYGIWRDPWMTINGDTYIHDVLRVCGGANVFGDQPGRYPTIAIEDIASRRPEVILLPDEPYRFRSVHVAEFDRFADLPAVRARRIHLVDGKPFSWHGPRLGEALRTVPALLRPRRG